MAGTNGVSDESHIRCKIIIELLGKPKQHIEKTIRMYVDKIKQDSGLIVLKNDFADAVPRDDFFSTFAELEMVVKGIPKLISFCFDYMPSSVEILKPEEFSLRKSAIQNFVNDLQSRLHDVDMIVKKQKNEGDFLKTNLSRAVTNVIMLTLSNSSMKKKDISRASGIHEKELDVFLKTLEKEGKISVSGDEYSILNS